jgi:hypothetical protein
MKSIRTDADTQDNLLDVLRRFFIIREINHKVMAKHADHHYHQQRQTGAVRSVPAPLFLPLHPLSQRR